MAKGTVKRPGAFSGARMKTPKEVGRDSRKAGEAAIKRMTTPKPMKKPK